MPTNGRKTFPPTIISFSDSQVLARAGYAAIYVIGLEGEDGSALKVGTARDVHARLGALQTGNWRPAVVYELLFVQADVVNEVEASIHSALNAMGLRINREWFCGGPDVVIETAKQVASALCDGEYMTCMSMLRRIKMWKIEAEGLALPTISHATSRQDTLVRYVADRIVRNNSLR